mgnify:CR=1 FL=1
MKPSTRRELKRQANKLRVRLRKHGRLSDHNRDELASIERRLTQDREYRARIQAFEYAISKED